jgi:RHS repeat-associated protein
VDDIRLVGGSLSNITTAFTYDSGNELSTRTVNSVTTHFTYDAWGRMASKYVADGVSASYAYRYGDKLYSVTSNFPGESNVSYDYGGDQKRRERTAGGTTVNYNWDLGWNLLNQETSGGTLAESYVVQNPNAEVATLLGMVSGSNPSTGAYAYFAHDHLGSVGSVYDASKTLTGDYAYTPYGSIYAQAGDIALTELPAAFTGKPLDPASGLYSFPYRIYSPELARWLSRDPLGMVDGPNVYGYLGGNPSAATDPLGTLVITMTVVTLVGGGVLVTTLIIQVTFHPIGNALNSGWELLSDAAGDLWSWISSMMKRPPPTPAKWRHKDPWPNPQPDPDRVRIDNSPMNPDQTPIVHNPDPSSGIGSGGSGGPEGDWYAPFMKILSQMAEFLKQISLGPLAVTLVRTREGRHGSVFVAGALRPKAKFWGRTLGYHEVWK